MDVQNEIQLISRVLILLFMASLFIGFLVEKHVACQSRKSDFGWHRVSFFTLLDTLKRVESLERFWAYLIAFRSCISNGKPDSRNYCI